MCPRLPHPLQPLDNDTKDVEPPQLSSKSTHSCDSGIDLNSYASSSSTQSSANTDLSYYSHQRTESPYRTQSPIRYNDSVADEVWGERRPRSLTGCFPSPHSSSHFFSSSAPASTLFELTFPNKPIRRQLSQQERQKRQHEQETMERDRKSIIEQASAARQQRRQKWIEKLTDTFRDQPKEFRIIYSSTRDKIQECVAATSYTSNDSDELTTFGSLKGKIQSPDELGDHLFDSFHASPTDFELVCNEVLARIEASGVLLVPRRANTSASCRHKSVLAVPEEGKYRSSAPAPAKQTPSPNSPLRTGSLSRKPSEGAFSDVFGTMRKKSVNSRPSSSRSDTSTKPSNIQKKPAVSPAKVWNSLLPWLQKNFDDILGPHNTGAIELQQVGPNPVIYITAQDPSVVNGDIIYRKLREVSDLQFQVEVLSGIVHRTAGSGRNQRICTGVQNGLPPQRGFSWPPNHAGFMRTVACGSSIGSQEAKATASFGGFVQLKFKEKGSWVLYGVTAHHLLQDRTADTPVGAGVNKGKLDGKEFPICQPALSHFADEKFRLCRYLDIQETTLQRLRHSISEEHVEQLKNEISCIQHQLDEINKIAESNLRLGRIIRSSGYGEMHEGHQMDWALIGDIPEERAEDGNALPGGNASTLFCQPGDQITQIAREDFFDNVGDLYEREACRNNTPPEPCGRVHGCGATSGAQNGYLSGIRSIVRLGKYDEASIECSFAPYDRLGSTGDSGSWIFNDFGAVVGMIIGRNERTNLTYFTPMNRIFEDIKHRTGATDIRIARFGEDEEISQVDSWEWLNFTTIKAPPDSRDSGIALSAKSRNSSLTTHSIKTEDDFDGPQSIDRPSYERLRIPRRQKQGEGSNRVLQA